MAEPLTIRKLIERLSSGDIRIPAFQRDFVWEPEQVAFLLDSIYKEFPIGTIILWKTDNRLVSEKDLGRFTLPEPKKDYPVNYVLDGQQRITSLFSVFQRDLIPKVSDWVDIYFDMDAKPNVQESSFIALNETEVDSKRHFPVKVLFDSVEYRKATEKLSGDQIKLIDKLQERFKEYLIPNEVYESDDRNRVAIVFARINRAGTRLEIFELLSAWSWSEQFDLRDKFKLLQEEITDHGYEELCDDQDLLLRICSGIITGETTPAKIIDLRGDDIRSQFDQIKNGIIGAIDFLKRELNVKSYNLLPFPGLLVPLSVYFATDKVEGTRYTDLRKEKLSKWFWRSIFSRRFSAGVNEKQAIDNKEMLALKENEKHEFKFPNADLNFNFSTSNFSFANANSKTTILLLSTTKPFSFISGATIDLDKVLQKVNKNEFHHIFPEKFLEKSGTDKKKISVIANICFLTRGDNNFIRDKSPQEYVKKIPENKLKDYLGRAFIPENLASLDFDSFLSARNNLLEIEAKKLMS